MKTPHDLSKRALSAIIAATATLLLAACGEKPSAAAASDAGHHDEAAEDLTHFSDLTELFLEFPSLVAGRSVTFAAHVTRLADFKPVAKGRLTVQLSGGGVPEERFVADAPSVAGIFKPHVTPKSAGERNLTIVLESDIGTVRHVLGPVTVFADGKAAKAGLDGRAQGEESIRFTKEQQWKIEFATAEAAMGVARASLSATATIRARPDGEAHVVAPVAGVLRAAGAFPRIGQQVKRGQVLATLSPRLGGETDQATLESNARKARIALDQATRERARLEMLFKEEAIAEKRLLDAIAVEQVAQSEFEAAQARASQLGDRAGIAVRAPIDGTIASVSVAPGAFVGEGAPLVHVANTGHLWLDARIPESEIGNLRSPTGAAFTVDGFANPFEIVDGRNGRLIAVGGVVDATTRTVPVIFEFANPGGALRLGMTARAQIFSGDGKKAVLVPAGAVQDESGTQVVYVQVTGESFERRIVQTGTRDGARIAIVHGLEPGQRVVSAGAYLVRLSASKAGPAGHAH